MNARAQLLESISETIQDYRAGEIPPPTPEHVNRWAQQFGVDVQVPILRELDYVLRQTYVSRKTTVEFVQRSVTDERLVGEQPCGFWKSVRFLNIQTHGQSQRDILKVFDDVLEDICGFSTADCGDSATEFAYIDEGIFSGLQARNDLGSWIRNDAPEGGALHIIMLVAHTLAKQTLATHLRNTLRQVGKDVRLYFWWYFQVDNQKRRKIQPVKPESVEQATLPMSFYLEESKSQYAGYPVPQDSRFWPYSGEEGQSLLEDELLIAGQKIINSCLHPKKSMRPLGFGRTGNGFGSMIVTYRNCPNNCPLALWWGDPNASMSSPLNWWYPLFPRKMFQPEVAAIPHQT